MKQIHADKTMAGYEYLLAYKVTVPIYDLTMEFVKTYIPYKSRTTDQMEQAARSGMQNIPEGYKQQSLAGYIKLSGVSRGSLEELLKDYLSYARQQKLEVWDKERAKREIREIGEIWEIIKKYPYLPAQPNFPSLPNDPTKAVNLLLTLIQQANFLIDKLIFSLKEKHTREGGFRENLFKKRLAFLGSKKFQRGFLRITKKSLITMFAAWIAITGSGLLYLFGPWNSKTEAAWFDDNWAYRKSIVVTNNTTAENNVYAAITGYDASDTNKYQSDCGDVRFVKQNGDLLDYTIATCGATTTFNVIFDTLAAGANIIYLYYGNPSAADGFLSSTSAAACTNCSVGTPASEEKGPGPVGYWKFNEGVDGTCSGGTNDACNSGAGGNGLDGAQSNMTTGATSGWQTEDQCIAGKCMRFDNSDDVINTGSNVAVDDLGAMALEAWIKPISQGENSAGVILAKNVGTSPSSGWLLQFAGTYALTFQIDGSTDLVRTTDNNLISQNKWNHIILTWDGVITTASSVHIYINGAEATYATTTNGANRVSDASSTLYIGNDSTGARTFDGTIDDVKVYNFVRTAAQIQTDFNARGSSKGSSAVLGVKDQKYLSDGLVGYWKEDETTNGATATDSSGNGTSLTDTATVVRSSGKFNNGGDFESGSSQYQSAADNTVLSITGSLTLAVWIKPETVTAGTYNILAKWDGANESYRLMQNGDEIRIELDSSGNYVETSSSNLAASTWYHVVGVYDSTAATAKVYINGVEATSTTTGTIPSSIGDDGGKFHIGAEDSTGGATGYYDGIIEEARVYSKAFSDKQIVALYDFAPGPDAYYKFEDSSSASTTNDSSSNANNATATNTPALSPGKFGMGYEFNGSNNYFTTGSAPYSTSFFSAMAWLKINKTPGSTNSFMGGNSSQWRMAITSSRLLSGCVGTTSNGCQGGDISGAALTLGTWYHVALVVNGTTTSLYLNSILQGTQTTGTLTAQVVRIGNASFGGGSYLASFIDDVRFYKYPRTQKQIMEDMNADHPAPDSSIGSALAYWKFDNAGGTTAGDSSRNAKNLTLSAASWTTSGKFGSALSAGTNQAFLAETSMDFVAADEFTISLWAKSSSATNPTTNNEYVLDKMSNGGGAGYGIYFTTTDGYVCFGIDDDATWGPDESVCSTTDYYDATWHHIVATKTGTSRIDLYVDNKSVASDTSLTTTGSLSSSGSRIRIGDFDNSDDGDEFNGNIDEVKVYKFLLSASQINLEYNRGSSLVLGALSDSTSGNQVQSAAAAYCIPGDSTSCAGPVGEYKFDNNSNDTSTKSYTLSTNQASFAPGKYGAGIYRISGNIAAVSDNSDFDVADDETFTIEIWFRSDGQNRSARRVIIGKKTNETASSAGYQITILTNGTLEGIVANGSQQISLTTTSVVDDSIWHHTVLTIDAAASGTSSLYLDGTLLDTDTTPTGTLANTDPLAFGYNDNNSAVFPFLGWLDHALLYKYVRSRAQIMWDMNKGAPIAHWKMDECQGLTINDSSGNSFTGTLTPGGAPISSAGDCTTSATTSWNGGSSGKINSSIKLDGTDDYVSVLDTANLRFDASTDDFSLFAWVKRVTTGTEYILSKEDADNDGWRLMFNSSNAVLCSEDATDVTSTSTITDTNWHFVGCTIDRDGNGQVYIDGRADGSTASMGTDAMATTSNLLIGARSYAPITNYLNGQIDDAKIFNYALTAVQVRTLYNGGAVRFAPVTGTP